MSYETLSGVRSHMLNVSSRKRCFPPNMYSLDKSYLIQNQIKSVIEKKLRVD